MTQVKITREVIKIATFDIFGTQFKYELDASDKIKKIPIQSIINILTRELVDAQYEHSRQDGKKVILFYKQSSQATHLMSFKFAVEADVTLQEMMRKHIDLENQLPAMIKYMFENKDTLNFKV